MTTIRYCANTCTRTNGDPITTEGRSNLCPNCEDKLDSWLSNITTIWPLLPLFIEHGTTARNPDTKSTKAAVAPAPMRLDVIDLLDTRRGRKWLGTAPAHDRRGPAGLIQQHVETIAEERHITNTPDPHDVAECARFLRRNRLWIAEQEWAHLAYEDIRVIYRAMSDAIGDYRPKPVGTCHLVATEATDPCGGPLLANTRGGVRCGRCRATWDADHLRQLGLAQATG